MKKILALVLVLMMAAAMVPAMAEGFTPAAAYDPGERSFNAGSVTLVEAGEGGGTVSTDVYAGEEGKDYTDEKVYTYHGYTSALTSSMNWDVLSWETQDDSDITDYIITGFYTFKMNSDKTGYSVVPEAAAEMPVDVTVEYAGTLGVSEGESGKAWRIALNPDLCWDDGTPVNADDFVYSMQQQLNPKMLNRRADSWYDGQFSIVNAKNYLYAGKTVYDPIPAPAAELLAGGEDVYLDMDFWGLVGALDADGNEAPQYVSVQDETLWRDAGIEEGQDEDWVSAKYIYETYLADGAPYADYAADNLKVASEAKAVTWDDVGFKKVDDYTIDFILEKPIAEAAFYVPYNLSGSFLVKKDLYEECKSFFDAEGKPVATEEEADSVTTTYCRSLDTTVSFGPYKLTSFQLDKEYTLSRNENWYGYKDGKHLGQYMTDNIVVTVIADHATAILAFESGEIDGVGLQTEDMDKYAASDYIHYTPQSYTTKLTFSIDYEKLVGHGTNSQILVIDEFRKGFAFALDANDFATAYTAAGTAGYGLLNYMYCYDPFTGALYRDSEPAKKALVQLYEMTFGEGGDYASVDEAYEAMTGYNMAYAQTLMTIAAEKAVDAGIWDGESAITLDIRVYNSDTIYVQMYNYFKNQLAEAVKGTKFEGKIDMTMTPDADYYNTMYSGGADMIFSTWGGSTMDPFGVIARCYCDASDGSGNQMEIGYDTTAIALTFDFDGIGQITDTLQHWAMWCNNATEDVPVISDALGSYADYDYSTRCEVLAGVERCYLNWFPTTSLYYRNVASLTSQKVQQASDTYLTLVGFGGFEYMTYHYDDEAWTEYTANNTLVY